LARLSAAGVGTVAAIAASAASPLAPFDASEWAPGRGLLCRVRGRSRSMVS
jgi:hypothetical protein